MKFFGLSQKQKKPKKNDKFDQSYDDKMEVKQVSSKTHQMNDLMLRLGKQAAKVKQTGKEHSLAKTELFSTLSEITTQLHKESKGDFDRNFFDQFSTTQEIIGHLLYDTASTIQKLFGHNFRNVRDESQKCDAFQKLVRTTLKEREELAEKVHTLSNNKHRDRATKKLLVAQQELLIVARKLGKAMGSGGGRQCVVVCVVVFFLPLLPPLLLLFLSPSSPSSSSSFFFFFLLSLPHVTNPFATSFSELLQTQVRRQTTKINAEFNKVVVEGMVELIERQDTHFKRLGGAVHDCETMLVETRKNICVQFVLQCVAVCCSVLQFCCSLLQFVAILLQCCVCELQQQQQHFSPTLIFVCALRLYWHHRGQATTWKPTALRQKWKTVRKWKKCKCCKNWCAMPTAVLIFNRFEKAWLNPKTRCCWAKNAWSTVCPKCCGCPSVWIHRASLLCQVLLVAVAVVVCGGVVCLVVLFVLWCCLSCGAVCLCYCTWLTCFVFIVWCFSWFVLSFLPPPPLSSLRHVAVDQLPFVFQSLHQWIPNGGWSCGRWHVGTKSTP